MIKTESTMVTIPLSRWEHAVLGLSGVVSLTVGGRTHSVLTRGRYRAAFSKQNKLPLKA